MLLYAMKNNQLTKGENYRVMYIENKEGSIGGIASNHFDEKTGAEY